MHKEQLLKVPKACELLGIHRMTLYAWIKKGEIEAQDISRRGALRPRYRIPEQAVLNYLKKHRIVSDKKDESR